MSTLQQELPHPAAGAYLATSESAEVLTEIYKEHCNIAVWQRSVSRNIKQDLSTLLKNHQKLELREVVSPERAESVLTKHKLGSHLSQDISELVDVFCCLFDLQQAGLRLTVLNHAMCPRFHIDHVPCRLVHSYCGPGTQWKEAQNLMPATNQIQQESGKINQIEAGDVALLKGSAWENSQAPALIHRSPNTDEKRLLLTLDFA